MQMAQTCPIISRRRNWHGIPLVLSLEKTPLKLIFCIALKDLFIAFKMLTDHYEPTDIDACTHFIQKMELCTMDDPTDDPNAQIKKLNAYNSRLGDIDPKYQKDETLMTANMLNRLPMEHH